MGSPTPPTSSAPPERPRPGDPGAPPARLAVMLLVGAILVCYQNTWQAPFELDDENSIVHNDTLPQWKGWLGPLAPPVNGTTVTGRPLANLTLALNYAVSGLDPWSYHLVNIAIHILAAVLLWDLLRQVLVRWGGATPQKQALMEWTALVAALVWAVHPLQTESVTYLSQRAESLAALFYLACLTTFWRGAAAQDRAQPRGGWFFLSVVLALLGGLAKETAATVPVLALVLDRLFLAGSWRAAWRRRARVYLGLALVWPVVAALILAGGNRGGSAGFLSDVSAWRYAQIQPQALLTYLRLALIPWPLVFDYGIITQPSAWLGPGLAVVAAILGATAWGLWRGRAWSLAGAWLILGLAPSSSVIPIVTQTMAEHRMYLPLAAVTTLAVVLAGRGLAALTPRRRQTALVAAALAALVALGVTTMRRNATYATELSLWQDTVRKAPANYRAWNNLGHFLLDGGDLPRARDAFTRANELAPDEASVLSNLGNLYFRLGDLPAAEGYARRAVLLAPTSAQAHHTLGMILLRRGDNREAELELRLALEYDPLLVEAHSDMGLLLGATGRLTDGIASLQKARQIAPRDAMICYNLGNLLLQAGDVAAAQDNLQTAVQLNPTFAQAWKNLGTACHRRGQYAQAEVAFRTAIELAPGDWENWTNLGQTYEQARRPDQALAAYQQALVLAPHEFKPALLLGQLLARLGQRDQAGQMLTALRRHPLYQQVPAAREALEKALTELGVAPPATAPATAPTATAAPATTPAATMPVPVSTPAPATMPTTTTGTTIPAIAPAPGQP